MMDVGFTGTQEGMTELQLNKLWNLLLTLQTRRVRHGMCVGADKQFHDMCRELGIYIIGYPGIDKNGQSPKRADCDVDEIEPEMFYLTRNIEIVRHSDVLIGTPKEHEEQTRSGTWSTIRKARKIHKTTFVIYPDGSTST